MKRTITPIRIDEETPQHRRLSWWLENSLVRFLKRLLNSSFESLRELFNFSLTDFIEDIERELIPLIKPFADRLLSIPNLPEWIKSPIREAFSGQSPAGLIIIASIIPILVSGLSQGVSGPISRIIQGSIDMLLRSRLLDPATLISMWYRDLVTEDALNTMLAMNGVNNNDISRLKIANRPLMDDNTLTNLLWRKELSVEQVSTELGKRGFTPFQIHHWLNLRNIIPSPGELISIAVREGFNDSVAQQFGYDEDYPTVAAEWAEKGGLSQTFFKAQWRAHWNLPGLVQVREMFNRGIIEPDDLNAYLKAADIPTFWRDALSKWVKRVVTRVDARRMYDIGVWDDKRVYDHHLELGYNEEDAADMTSWVVLNYLDKDRELTKSDILQMYEDGILNIEEARAYLTGLDYKPHSVELLLIHRDLKREEKFERAIIANIKALYIGGLYDRTSVFSALGKISTPDAVIQQSLAVWDLERERKVRVPSVTQLRDMVLKDVISQDTFITEMRNKKYPDKYITWYVNLWLTSD